ncbi:MAG: GH3 auxin-responsive promoter family protein, partial [Dehalococcoidales bacterium]
MTRVRELMQQGNKKELWQACCGFIDLSMDEFMDIQSRLILEQINLLKESKIGQKIFNGASPNSIDDFRELIPFTTYEDYCPELLEQQEDTLPSKVVRWTHTSGKSGKYRYKWMPIPEGTWEEMSLLMCAASIFATCHEKGDVDHLPKNFLYATANAPYTTGVIAYKLQEEFGYKFFPPLDDSGEMTFLERLEKGIQMSLAEGIDGIYGFTNILVAIGERIKSGSGNVNISNLLTDPKALFRVLKALIKSKLAGRPVLPRDLWSLKGMVCGGADSIIFKHRIKDMWGVYPLDIYASTEALIVAMQTWDYEGMTFVPNLNFLEFIPESDCLKWNEDNSYEMKTVLLDEVKAGEIYELVITNFHGGPLARYRTGDMVKIESLINEMLNINIPQMSFHRRADDVIFLGNIFRLTETVIWRAIENTGIEYADWTANKEVYEGSPILRIYLELKESFPTSEEQLELAIYENIKKLNDGFIHNIDDIRSMEELMDLHPIRVTSLPIGAFQNYSKIKQAEGADLAQLKPPR